jgi:SAM-dependent methyltransferase
MSEHGIRFDNGVAYEHGMGIWSRLAGQAFLDWIAPPAGLRWLDVGCGNGAFTELLIERCTPSTISGVDPSLEQLQYARTRPGAAMATFRQGDAMALPFPDDAFDAAAMALVIFFVPDPAKGVKEMIRTVRPGGIVSAYAWNFTTGGFPYGVIQEVLRAHGTIPPLPPNAAVAQEDALHALWTGAGIDAVSTRTITVQRTFRDFDDYWTASVGIGGLKPTYATVPPATLDRVKADVRSRLTTSADGQITHTGWASAVTGRVR